MSNVVSPRGPLPPKVYWRRRLVTLAVLVGIVVLVGRTLGGDDTEAASDRGAPAPSPSAQASPAAPTTLPEPAAKATAGSARERADERRLERRRERRRAVRESRAAELSGPAGPLARPAGVCQASEVVLAPDVEDTDAFAAVPLRVGLSGTGDQACTFAFGPDTVALRVTSGDDLIWESLTCPRALEEQSVVVRPAWLTYVEVDWSGRRAGEGCGDTGEFAQPGYYWVEAAALGGEPQRSQFELETPPKPEPTAKPSEGESAKPGDEPTSGSGDGQRPVQRDPAGESTDEDEKSDEAGPSPRPRSDGEQQER